jgi:flagellar biosynthesis protein
MSNQLTYAPKSQVHAPEVKPEALNHAKQQAIALAYETGDFAPKVVAKGRGLIAEQIIAKAKEHNVFVHESKDLVALLMQVDLDDHIPPVLYQAIAEILAWLYNLEHGVQQAPLESY